MTTIDPRLVRKGAGVPLGGMIQQLDASIRHWDDHKDALAADGFKLEKGARMKALRATLDSAESRRADSREGAKDLGVSEAAARNALKAVIRKGRNVLPQALREMPVDGVTEDAFNSGETLGQNTKRIVGYVRKIAETAKKVDPALMGYFRGQKWSDLLVAGKDRLEKADADQDAALNKLPLETQAVYQLKGEALQLVEDLNAVAKNAFDGNAGIIGLFNKDKLLEARKKAEEPRPVG